MCVYNDIFATFSVHLHICEIEKKGTMVIGSIALNIDRDQVKNMIQETEYHF